MVNLKEDAFPSTVSYSDESPEVLTRTGGFTKLEYAPLLIAQGLATRELLEILEGENYPSGVAKLSISIAKAVIEEANK